MTSINSKTRFLLPIVAFAVLMVALLAGAEQASTAPKSVNLTSFKTSCGRGMVVLTWTTDMERFTQGYHLYRSTAKSSLGERITGTMIPQNGGNGGGNYVYNDRAVAGGVTYFYTVEEIAMNGGTTLHGPVTGMLNCNSR
jgi:hypothetical protein